MELNTIDNKIKLNEKRFMMNETFIPVYDEPTCYMMIGVPGSGKSTVVDTMMNYFLSQRVEYSEKIPVVLSTDSILTGIALKTSKTYDEVFHSHIKEAEALMYKELTSAIEHNYNIIWDQTNLSKKSRSKKLFKLPSKYKKIAVVISTPEEEVHKKMLNRPGKFIDEKIISSMKAYFEYPDINEFDEVIIVPPVTEIDFSTID